MDIKRKGEKKNLTMKQLQFLNHFSKNISQSIKIMYLKTSTELQFFRQSECKLFPNVLGGGGEVLSFHPHEYLLLST